jgi:methylmalonyl-CoA mutase
MKRKNWSRVGKDPRRYSGDELVYTVRGREIRVPLYSESLSHQKIPKISLPRFTDPGEIYSWLRRENLPGYFPFTAGVFPMKRMGEDPTRMFAGEGDPARTNRRFKMLSANSEAKRLSTAFDSVTLYGYDPDRRPDIYGKVGNAGVSVCTLDDVKVLYGGFELCAPTTSVSMTINGPAPIMLAMFLNTAIDQQVDKYATENGRQPSAEETDKIKAMVLENVRGTVQADILKEDQGQNTCIFSIDFALKMMGDIQAYFIDNNVRNFYSVSISGYHIAEAGANPISQLAFTLANGFTYLEYYLSRGMPWTASRPTSLFSSPTAWIPSTRLSAGWPAASGPWPCGRSTARRCAARCSNTTSRPPGAACTARTFNSMTSAPPCRPCAPFTTTARACTPTPSTRPLPPPPKSRCAVPWPSS